MKIHACITLSHHYRNIVRTAFALLRPYFKPDYIILESWFVPLQG